MWNGSSGRENGSEAGGDLEVGACTDRGRVRGNNEDSLCLAPELGLFVLSDGMGGQTSGEVASRLAAETVVAHCRETEKNPTLPIVGEPMAGAAEASNRLASAIRAANEIVYRQARKNPAYRGMGATIVAVRIAGERMSVAHVGDSRLYRLRAGEFEQLTRDHSFVAEQVRRGTMTPQEACRSKLQNVLLRALGVDPQVQVELEEELVREGDILLLCSDGLTRELPDEQIAAVLRESDKPQQAANRLVDLANQAGGEDNISVVVLRRAPKLVGALARIGRWFKGSGDLP